MRFAGNVQLLQFIAVPFTLRVRGDMLLQLPPDRLAAISWQIAPVPRFPDWMLGPVFVTIGEHRLAQGVEPLAAGVPLT